MKNKIVSILIIIIIISSILIYLSKKQNPVCFFGKEKTLNNCNCKYECGNKNNIHGVCDRLCPQEIKVYK